MSPHLIAFLVYESVEDAHTRIALRSCDKCLRDVMLPQRGTLTTRSAYNTANAMFNMWKNEVQQKHRRSIMNAWSNIRRHLHAPDDPILLF